MKITSRDDVAAKGLFDRFLESWVWDACGNICSRWVVNVLRGIVEASRRGGGEKQETASGVNVFNKWTSTKLYFTHVWPD